MLGTRPLWARGSISCPVHDFTEHGHAVLKLALLGEVVSMRHEASDQSRELLPVELDLHVVFDVECEGEDRLGRWWSSLVSSARWAKSRLM